jgi:hypothetical protein
MWVELCCSGVGLGWGGVMRCDVMCDVGWN